MLRNISNPIITSSDMSPSHEKLKIDGVFNAGACYFNDEIVLILRVAESYNGTQLKVPIMKKKGIEFISIDINNKNYDFTDSRVIIDKTTNKTKYLTSISHLRIAKSRDGINFIIDKNPIKIEYDETKQWGIEDPRVTNIGDIYYINYTAVSQLGALTSLVATKDFNIYENKGIIFMPENKDICIINEKINGLYHAYSRPVPKAFGDPDIWISQSPDLIHWGNSKHFLSVGEKGNWDEHRIGGGAPSIKLKEGWLNIYHGCDLNNVYSLGAFLTKIDDPSKIIKKSINPILKPDKSYEKKGFFNNVVFTCGVIRKEENLLIYYGACDDKVCLAEITINKLLKNMEDYES